MVQCLRVWGTSGRLNPQSPNVCTYAPPEQISYYTYKFLQDVYFAYPCGEDYLHTYAAAFSVYYKLFWHCDTTEQWYTGTYIKGTSNSE